MDDRMLRTARGLAAACIALFVAAFSHVIAGGGPPAGAGLALSAAFAAIVCTVLTRRRPSLPLLAVSVGLSQAVFHLLFAVGDGTGSGLEVAVLRHGSHVTTTLVEGGSAAMHDHAGSGLGMHGAAWMWAAHAVAAVVTIAVIRHGEVCLRRLLLLGRVQAERGAHAAAGFIPVLRRLLAHLAAVVGRLAGALEPAPAPFDRPGRRASILLALRRLRDLGAAFTRLRFRGPPVRFALRTATPALP